MMNAKASSNVTMISVQAYCEAFAEYLGTGNEQALARVFPDAQNLQLAAVYRNGFMRSCVDALRANYPTVDSLVGSDYFNFLATEYVQYQPPQRGTLVGYGGDFPDFLKSHEDKHQLLYLHSFAQLDAAWTRAYFAADSNNLNSDDVQAWLEDGGDIPSMPAMLVSSASVQQLNYAVSALWTQLKQQSEFDGEVSVLNQAENVLVWRDASNQIVVKSLSLAELAFISSLVKASTIGTAASAALCEDVAFDVGGYFSSLLEHDLLSQA